MTELLEHDRIKRRIVAPFHRRSHGHFFGNIGKCQNTIGRSMLGNGSDWRLPGRTDARIDRSISE
ncbi:hypothetical protein [Paraburkholderia sp. RL17-337-BIB-A]|uniref:hypothetical protein n=1 Tax=Paraburkholderia sp. RL17-337-BIB-A TaxID=3031636 RepID=UPI0038B7190F